MGANNIYSRQDDQHNFKGRSKLVAIRIGDIENSLEWFGNYTREGDTPIVLIPSR